MDNKPPEPATVGAADPLQLLIEREQSRMVLAHTEFGVLAATAFAVLAAMGLLSGQLASVDSYPLWTWLTFKIAVVVPRLISARFARSPNPRTADVAAKFTVPLLAVDGIVWGIGGAALMSFPVDTWSLAAACICCVACVATFGLQIRLAATAAYVVPMIAPVALALLLRGGAAANTAALGLALLLALLLSTSKRSERRLTEMIELRFQSEQVSAERARALALAEGLSQAKDRFLAMVSHELRTPLHGVIGLTRLARSDMPQIAATALACQRLELIEEASQHLQRMVNDLLDISFMESGRLQLKPAPFHLLHELSVITETYTARAPEIGVRFRPLVQPSLEGFVVGDSSRIAQVLHNLLGNAFKFTPLGGTITLAVERLHGTDQIQFAISDTGPGVPEAERESIFEIFTQGTIAGTRPDGVGLGLAISRQLARAMGGDVVCRPGPGSASGTTFVFTASLPTTAADISHPETASKAPRPRSSYAGLTIYVADDDQISTLIHGSVVRMMGCELEVFTNGQALVDRILTTREHPAGILIDWDMPILDGPSAVKAIRRHEQTVGLPPVPIVGLSGNPSAAFAEAALEAGMTAFLTKPCPSEVIASTLAGLVGREPVDALIPLAATAVASGKAGSPSANLASSLPGPGKRPV